MHELDLAERRTGVVPSGLELRDASPGWDAGRLEPALVWAAEGRVKVGLVPYFSRFMATRRSPSPSATPSTPADASSTSPTDGC